jgi:DNA-binding CsgD family transcriptional regulator
MDPTKMQGRRPPFSYWASESVDRLRSHLEAELSGELNEPGHAPLRAVFRKASGQRIPVSLTCDMVRDAGGKVCWHVALIRPDHRSFGDRRKLPEVATRVEFLERLLHRIAHQVAEAGVGIPFVAEAQEMSEAETLEEISPRQWEILEQVLEGQRVPIIGQRLGISPHTVRAHLKSIFRKLGVRSQAELLDKLHPAH